MLLGAHVSAANGIYNAPLNASKIGCEVFQMFSRSPRGGNSKPLTKPDLLLFKKNCEEGSIKEWYIHCPYYINYASKNSYIKAGSIKVVREELERGTLLGAKYVMTHLGSYKDLGEKEGYKQVVSGLVEMLKGYKGTTEFLIEISAGAGNVIGDTFEEIAEIVHNPKLKKLNIGVCYDTQHAFASGYDCRTPEAFKETLKKFDSTIGLDRLKMSHCNDSKPALGSHVDRHEHIGKGQIGTKGFEAILGNKDFQKINLVLETEPDLVAEDLRLLKKIREKA